MTTTSIPASVSTVSFWTFVISVSNKISFAPVVQLLTPSLRLAASHPRLRPTAGSTPSWSRALAGLSAAYAGLRRQLLRPEPVVQLVDGPGEAEREVAAEISLPQYSRSH
jgi:hypothetical protein